MTTKTGTEILVGCGAALLFMLVVLPIQAILGGFVLSQLWGWFMVPFGVVAISIPWAIGLSLLVGTFTMTPNVATKDQQWYEMVGTVISAYLFVWGVGAIVHLFM